MPVFDQGYGHWTGRLAGHRWRWLPITRQGVRAQIKNRWAKYIVFLSLFPALALVVFLAIWGLLEQQSDAIKPLLGFFQNLLPPEVIAGPRAFRAAIWTVAFHVFYKIEVWSAMVLVLLVGPDLISQDLRYNAMPLYLSRPLRRRDYFLGKLGVIVTFVAAATALPAALAYVVGVAFSLEWSVIGDTWRIGLGAVGFGLLVAFSSGLVMLGFSSLSKNSRQVAMLWIGLILVGNMVGEILAETLDHHRDEKPWRTVSYMADLGRVQEVMLGTESAMLQLDHAFKESILAAQRAAKGASGLGRLGLFGGRRPFAPPPPPPPPSSSNSLIEGYVQAGLEPDPARPMDFLAWLRSDTPAPLAAGVLGGLALLALVILSTRIQSLDRLR